MAFMGFGRRKRPRKATASQGLKTDAETSTAVDPSPGGSTKEEIPTAEADSAIPPPNREGGFKLAAKSKKFSIIDHGLTVEGTVIGQGQLVVKGTIKGKLEGEEVVVAEEGTVEADTKAKQITIGGRAVRPVPDPI
jgi:hypothetical protein